MILLLHLGHLINLTLTLRSVSGLVAAPDACLPQPLTVHCVPIP